MSIIQCDEDCLYQQDGYCSLEMPSAITNYTGDGCVHCIRVTPRKEFESMAAPYRAVTTAPAPQTLL